MKNYPNQISDFSMIRSVLAVINDLNGPGSALDPSSSLDLGYELVDRRLIGFRDTRDPSPAELAARVQREQERPAGDQGPQTTARELRRTLRNLGWLDESAVVTAKGHDLLATTINSTDEQALLVEGLLAIEVEDEDGFSHHPVQTLLRLLSVRESHERKGLELALEPKTDSDAEFKRVRELYDVTPEVRLEKLAISSATRANAVKIFPRLAVAAGLVIEEKRVYSLSQDGWKVIGQSPDNARKSISRRRGRRVTVGRKVDHNSIAGRQRNAPPRTLSPEEQERAAERLNERTASHQGLVKRIAALIDLSKGSMFEDEFSYDMLWVPEAANEPALLFEMKSITTETDAYARVRDANGQLSYYEHFHVRPTLDDRPIKKVAAFNTPIPEPLVDFLTMQSVGVLIAVEDVEVEAANQLGKEALVLLP